MKSYPPEYLRSVFDKMCVYHSNNMNTNIVSDHFGIDFSSVIRDYNKSHIKYRDNFTRTDIDYIRKTVYIIAVSNFREANRKTRLLSDWKKYHTSQEGRKKPFIEFELISRVLILTFWGYGKNKLIRKWTVNSKPKLYGNYFNYAQKIVGDLITTDKLYAKIYVECYFAVRNYIESLNYLENLNQPERAKETIS